MTPDQHRVAQGIASGPRGSWQRGPFKALLRSPEIADRVQKVGEFVRFKSSIEPRLNELAIILCARKWTAQYEWYAHREFAIRPGSGPRSPTRSPRAAARDLQATRPSSTISSTNCCTTGQVGDAAFGAVRRNSASSGVIELIGAVGYYTIVSFVLNVDRVPMPPDATPLKAL